jgi:hypothetical protein
MRWKASAVLLVAFCQVGAGASHGRAQSPSPKASPGPAAPGETPTFTGRGKVTDAVNTDTGAIFDMGTGITMTFPKGLPVGRSRIVTLEKAKPLPAKLIPGFKPLGPAVLFSGAFGTAGKPIVLAIATKNDPSQRGMKLVLAMEVGTFCEAANKAYRVSTGLCSGFELQDAEYDPVGKRLLGKLVSTGGLRLQFGFVPEAAK